MEHRRLGFSRLTAVSLIRFLLFKFLSLIDMRKFLTVITVIISLFTNGQNNCNPTTIPTDIYYPNSITTPTNNFGREYLCGPNTLVYDTIEYGCHFVYVNSGCTLFFKPTVSCAAASYIWLKNNSILNIVQGIGPTFIFHETNATINNPYLVTVSSYSCASITFPTVNCIPNGIKENNSNTSTFEIYPNPAFDKLNIEFTFGEKEFTKAEIINSIGQVIKEIDLSYTNKKATININELQNGVYVLKLSSRGTRDLNSDSSYRRNDNTLSATKRFVITR